jgi:hypothetical protein
MLGDAKKLLQSCSDCRRSADRLIDVDVLIEDDPRIPFGVFPTLANLVFDGNGGLAITAETSIWRSGADSLNPLGRKPVVQIKMLHTFRYYGKTIRRSVFCDVVPCQCWHNHSVEQLTQFGVEFFSQLLAFACTIDASHVFVPFLFPIFGDPSPRENLLPTTKPTEPTASACPATLLVARVVVPVRLAGRNATVRSESHRPDTAR